MGYVCAFYMRREAMVSRILKVPSFDLAVFGGTGDLARRKVFPHYFTVYRCAVLAADQDYWRVAAALGSRRVSVAIAAALKEFAATSARDEAIKSFLELIHYVRLDIDSEAGWDLLGSEFDDDPSRVRAFYLATDPD